ASAGERALHAVAAGGRPVRRGVLRGGRTLPRHRTPRGPGRAARHRARRRGPGLPRAGHELSALRAHHHRHPGVDGRAGARHRAGEQAGGGGVPQPAQPGSRLRGAARRRLQPGRRHTAGIRRPGPGSRARPMSAPALPALVPPRVRAFLADRRALDEAVAHAGTPVHLVFPQVLADNADALRTVLDRAGVRHRICYAHKVNRSRALAVAAREAGLAVDVASPEELDSARAAGFVPGEIEWTGPKGEAALRRAVLAGVTVNVDNLWELGELDRLARALPPGAGPVPVLLRVGEIPGTPFSRFGIPLTRTDRALSVFAAPGSRIELCGVAFHLDSGAVADRVRAAQACLRLVERAHTHGLAPTVLDVGGGLRPVVTADGGRFDAYVRALRDGLTGRGAPLTWAGHTFGYHVDDGAAHGTPVFHKYGNTVTAPAMLAELLAAPLPEHDHRPLARVLADNLLELWLEP